MPKVNRENIVGMKVSQLIGSKLAETHPEIVKKYRDGSSLDEIAQEKDNGNYQISPHVTLNAVRYCLIELIGKEEQAMLGKDHMHLYAPRNGKRGGTASFKKGVGCFGMSKEKQRQARLKGGKVAGAIVGKRNYDNGIGIASLTAEELRENGVKSVIARGLVPYENDVINTDYGEMTEKSLIVYLKGVERLPWKEITRKVNSNFGNNRSLESIRGSYNSKWRKD